MSDEIPPVAPPPVDVSSLSEERQFADLDQFDRIDVALRAGAGQLALFFAVIFWIGALILAVFVANRVGDGALPGDGRWGVLIALIVALFSVPSLIVLTIFTSTKKKRIDGESDIPHASVVDAIVKAIKE